MDKTCVEKLKVIERRMKVLDDTVDMLLGVDKALRVRIKHLETALMALQVGVGDGSRHRNDGGWFD